MLNKITSFILILFAGVSFTWAQEKIVTEIILEGSANDRTLEMSGLTWYKDELILLPQYIDYDDPAFYSISKHQLNNWLNQKLPEPIVPQKIKIKLPDFRKSIKGQQISQRPNQRPESQKCENLMFFCNFWHIWCNFSYGWRNLTCTFFKK